MTRCPPAALRKSRPGESGVYNQYMADSPRRFSRCVRGACLAFALAAQDTLANIFGAIVVAIDQPFKLGEFVRIGGNIGYPVAPNEIAWFMAMLKKAAPKITEAELNALETKLKSYKRG